VRKGKGFLATKLYPFEKLGIGLERNTLVSYPIASIASQQGETCIQRSLSLN
jgi:hypothetical protein